MNESVTEVFVEQPLASPGSAKDWMITTRTMQFRLKWPRGRLSETEFRSVMKQKYKVYVDQ